jgi:MtaA/CmuA family methyltransferase
MAVEMTSIERVQSAISLEKPDRVPVDLHNFQPAARAAGMPLSEIFQDGELLAQAMLEAWREFGHDMILLENGTACNAQACGVEVVYREDTAPAAVKPVIASLEEAANLEVPEPYKTFPMSEVLKAASILSKEIGDRAWICARADQGPMGLASQLRGISELMLDIALGEREDLIHALLDYSCRVAARFAYALIECGGRSTSIGDSIAGPDLLSPRHYKEYAWVHENRLLHDMKKKNIIMHLHICGDIIPILGDFIASGAPVLEVDHKTDSQKVKDAARDKTCLLGNINTGLMMNGTPEEVEHACCELIKVWKPGGGFILGPGCALGTDTPADNIHALVESAKKYGQYH